ncbi:DUF2779 domain-containing protein [Rubritalea profundi]|uniref:DUF2779 domain-containing protein n=1 Tax=Rubritalea profundi TaxID=1658618 RepID=A0A2S7U401_9BACT|nr:DUF2779 domain-containing protein [Rubritalea profundi]PQJ29745.1 hypothetical protein BSZ32_15485 [Rubritalea profundi]
MRHLSKSKLVSFRQCPKRLWLDIHKPELRDNSAYQHVFGIGNRVGEIAMKIYDTTGDAYEISISELGFNEVFQKSAELLDAGDRPIFEAGVKVAGGLAFADVMIPSRTSGELCWKMVEVKSATKTKDYHRDDAALLHYLFEQAGAKLHSVSVAHIDNSFVYAGDGNYQGLLLENDITEEVRSRVAEMNQWIADAQATIKLTDEPEIGCGTQCHSPFTCPFLAHCSREDGKAEHPLSLLPNFHGKKANLLAEQGVVELADVPKDFLSEIQQRVQQCTLSGETYFDSEATVEELSQYGFPAYFLDFETSNSAVPMWKGTRPYQQLPFQFSVHVLDEDGTFTQESFLDLSGNDPRLGFTESLLQNCGNSGPIFVYNIAFERKIINQQAAHFPQHAKQLGAIADRLVDLLPIARAHYYHPSQCGKWGIKSVLPAISPDLDYSELDGVKDGNMAMVAFQEAIHPDTSEERKTEIYNQLDKYCQLDTLAMVRIWEVFTGKQTRSIVS